MYSIDPKTGKRLYTLKKAAPDGKASTSAHPGKSTLDANFHGRQTRAHLADTAFFFSPTCFVPHSSIFTGRQIFSPACCMQKTFWYSSHSTTTRSDVNTFCSSTLYKKRPKKKTSTQMGNHSTRWFVLSCRSFIEPSISFLLLLLPIL